jgi:hypothetical protein
MTRTPMKKNHPWRGFKIKNNVDEQSIKDYNTIKREPVMKVGRKSAYLSRA